MTSWDDLRLVLAVARAGNLSAAARRLGVNHATVYRRLGALEAHLGARVFERLRAGYAPTAAGEDLLRTAARVEAEMDDLERRLAGRDHRLSGTVRVTAPDDVAEHLLIGPLARFRARYPDIVLELVLDNRMLSLTRREADVAVRPTAAPDETLVGRRVARLASAVYGAAAVAGRAPAGPADLAGRPWVAWEEGAGPPAMARWMARHVPPDATVYRANSLLNLLAAIRAGIGLGVLPCFLGDGARDLGRVLPPQEDLATGLWLLTHRDLQRTARVRAVLDALYRDLRARRGQLEASEA